MTQCGDPGVSVRGAVRCRQAHATKEWDVVRKRAWRGGVRTLECPFKHCRCAPLHMSHMQIVESRLALATLSSCLMTMTSMTMSECPAMQLVSSRALMSHECTSPVVEPEYSVVYCELHARLICT